MPRTETTGKPKKSKYIKRILQYFIPYKWLILLGVIASCLVSLATAGTAWLIKPAMDEIFINKDLEALFYVPLLYIVMMFVKGAGRYVQSLCMSYTALNVLKMLRRQLFDKIICLPLSYYAHTQIGTLMSRVINDVNMISASLTSFVSLLRQVITLISLLCVVFYQNFELACWALLILPIAASPIVAFSRALRRYGRKGAEVNAEFSATLQELFSGVRVIKAFATEVKECGRFDADNAKLIRIAFKRICVGELASPIMELIAAVGIGSIIWYGGTRVIEGYMTPGTFFSFIAALIMLYDPFKHFNSANMEVQNALAGADRVFTLLDDPALTVEHGGERLHGKGFEELVFDKVSLGYEADDGRKALALADVSLTLKAGRTLALVGPSGAGKTSLANLIPRFYDPTEGRILLNGYDTREYTLPSLRDDIAVVSQDAFLFDTTIAENIAYGATDATEEKIAAAAKAAYADEFIDQLPDGYGTHVGERGVKLSGGQKQRITIARALLKNASLLILDEATSALDSESERMVQAALDNLMAGRTCIVIAHRLSTILSADAIAVMDKGLVIDIGTHAELLQRCALYKRLYDMQFSGNA